MTDDANKTPANPQDRQNSPADPFWSSFDGLRQEFNRLFDDFHPLSWRSSLRRPIQMMDLPKVSNWLAAPAVDVTESDGHYRISAELPGLDEKDVEVKVANGALTIRGEKKEEREEEKKDYHLSERRYGSFERRFRLPEGVDADKIEAQFSKGLLTINLPKTAAAIQNEKKIEIKAG